MHKYFQSRGLHLDKRWTDESARLQVFRIVYSCGGRCFHGGHDMRRQQLWFASSTTLRREFFFMKSSAPHALSRTTWSKHQIQLLHHTYCVNSATLNFVVWRFRIDEKLVIDSETLLFGIRFREAIRFDFVWELP